MSAFQKKPDHVGNQIDDVRFSAPAQPVRDQIRETAGSIINGARKDTYGDAQKSFDAIAALWSVILDTRVTASDVARCMVAMKLARLSGSNEHRDSWVDIAGYAALGAEVAGA